MEDFNVVAKFPVKKEILEVLISPERYIFYAILSNVGRVSSKDKAFNKISRAILKESLADFIKLRDDMIDTIIDNFSENFIELDSEMDWRIVISQEKYDTLNSLKNLLNDLDINFTKG